MRSSAHVQPDGVTIPNLYPLLAEALAERCTPYPDREVRGGGKYRPLATELPVIAAELGTLSPLKDKNQTVEATMEIVERARIDMRKGSRSQLAPAMIVWLWRKDEQYMRRLFRKIGFDLAVAYAILTNESLAQSELLGVASNSLYTLQGQIEATRSRLILIAQNHWHMVSTADRHADHYGPLLLAALERGIDIDVIAMHPDIGPRGQIIGDRPASAVAVWSLFMNTPEFPEQLEICWQRLEQWGAAYRNARNARSPSQKMGVFRAFGAYLIPNTISVIDPGGQDGMMVVSPRTSDPKSASRPQFAIYKDNNPEGFTYYWSYIENSLSDRHWFKMIG